MHPKYGTTLNVDIDGSFTVEEMIHNLLLSGFINQNKAGYDLALQELTLERQATFDEIQELYDGAVIRIIAHKEDAPQETAAPSVKYLTLHIKHPSETLILDLTIQETAPLSEVIQSATDKNFVKGGEDILHLQKGDKLLDLNKTAAENQVFSGDYLLITHADSTITDPIETAVSQLNDRLETLEQQLEKQLQNIKDSLPAANMIPIDPTRAVNPTMEVYESIDTIVNRLRKDSKQEPLKPIRPFPTKMVVTLGIILVIIGFLLLILFGII